MSYCFYEQSNNRYEGHYLHRKYIIFFFYSITVMRVPEKDIIYYGLKVNNN
jgi:hypothetical protein